MKCFCTALLAVAVAIFSMHGSGFGMGLHGHCHGSRWGDDCGARHAIKAFGQPALKSQKKILHSKLSHSNSSHRHGARAVVALPELPLQPVDTPLPHAMHHHGHDHEVLMPVRGLGAPSVTITSGSPIAGSVGSELPAFSHRLLRPPNTL